MRILRKMILQGTKNRVNSSRNGQLHYGSIDGLRAISALGIVVMHVSANSPFEYGGNSAGMNFVLNTVIPQFNWFVFLFMVISGFGMCCGYYEGILDNTVSISDFYKKRYNKVWPFWAFLVLIDIIITHSFTSLYEAFADLTLTFALLPNAKISVIGVGWTLGVIFLFYMLFPFFCFLIRTKKSAWISLILAIIYNFVCVKYFFDKEHVLEGFSPKNNIIFCAMFFLSGGLIYLYRDILQERAKDKKIWKIGITIAAIGSIIVFWLNPWNRLFGENSQLKEFVIHQWYLITFSIILIWAICCDNKILNNKVTIFLSSISMEIYLSHMVVFRVLEKVGLVKLLMRDGKMGNLEYMFLSLITVGGAVIFSVIVQVIIKKYILIKKGRECENENSICYDKI